MGKDRRNRVRKGMLRTLSAVGLSLMILTHPAGATEKILSIDAWQKQAEALGTGEDYNGQEIVYTKAIAQYPTYTDFYVGRGQTYLHLGDTGRAAADFRRALMFDDQCTGAWLGQATLHACKGEMQTAWALFEKARTLMGENPIFYLRRGKYYYQGIADYPHAFADIEKAISLASEEQKPLMYLAKLVAEYDYAIQYDNSYIATVLEDTAVLLKAKNMPHSVKAQICVLRANAYIQQENYPQSFRETELALALSGDNAPFQAMVFKKQYAILHHMKLAKEERTALEAALKRAPDMSLPRKYESHREAMYK